MVDISVVTYNVRGLCDSSKRRSIFNYLHDHGHKIVLLQETHSTPGITKYWTSEWGGKIFFAHGTSSARGTAILIDRSIIELLQIDDIVRDVEGRYVIIKCKLKNIPTTIAVCYAPNNDEPNFFQTVFSQIRRFNTEDNIIGGDFNTILTNEDIKGGAQNTHPKCTNFLHEVMEDMQMCDVWRTQNPNKFQFTWCKKHPYLLMERIDYILISFHMQQNVISTEINPAFLGGLNLHLNHLIGSGVANYDWQFGTLPFGLF